MDKKLLFVVRYAKLVCMDPDQHIINDYLRFLEQPRINRRAIELRLRVLNYQIARTPTADRVELIQERITLTNQLDETLTVDQVEELEQRFISVAKAYSERNGLSREAWRAMGVPALILDHAKIHRGRVLSSHQ